VRLRRSAATLELSNEARVGLRGGTGRVGRVGRDGGVASCCAADGRPDYRDQGSQSLAIRFTGRVPASRAAQRVTLLVRECSSRFYRQIGGTTTTGGGTWEMTAGGGYGFPMAPSGSTYRARWNGRFTVPFAWRTQLVPGVTKLSASRFRVTVYTGYASPLRI
jgi:hypothetical protein